MSAFWIALVALVVFAFVRGFARTEPTPARGERSEEPQDLKRRLTSGEIDVDPTSSWAQRSAGLAVGQ